jgi:hypothetical protein
MHGEGVVAIGGVGAPGMARAFAGHGHGAGRTGRDDAAAVRG